MLDNFILSLYLQASNKYEATDRIRRKQKPMGKAHRDGLALTNRGNAKPPPLLLLRLSGATIGWGASFR
jgi:hypothetical protein